MNKVVDAMHVLGICGSSGSGKTRLAKKLVSIFSEKGQQVSVIKHAHHNVEVDTPGKDSWLLRKAGAYETMLVTTHRIMLIRELEQEELKPDVHEIISSMQPCDWLIIEGFKHADLNKIEVWRECVGKPAIYPNDAYVQAVVTDDVGKLDGQVDIALHSTEDIDALYEWIMNNAHLFKYQNKEIKSGRSGE